MVTTKLNLSMTDPEIRTLYAKQGDSGRVIEVELEDATEENGTLRILRPDGVEVTADAIKTASGDAYKGDLVTFDALEEVPLTKCEVTLEPIQDLSHGDPSPTNICPIIGANEKNLLNMARTEGTLSGSAPTPRDFDMTKYYVGFAVNNYYDSTKVASYTLLDGGVKVTSNNRPYGVAYPISVTPNTTYTISYVGSTNGEVRVGYYDASGAYLSGNNVVATGASITTPSSCVILVIAFTCTINGEGAEQTYTNVQLELGSSATPYVPYQGIDVEQRGKNLNPNVGVNYTVSSSTLFYLKQGTYTYSTNNGEKIGTNNQVYIRLYDDKGETITSGNITSSNMQLNGSGTLFYGGNGESEVTFNLLKDAYIKIGFNNQTPTNFSHLQIEKGETATSYEPYQGSTHSLSLGRTVYGGKVDLVSGKLTITKECVSITSDSGNKWIKSSSYPGGFYCSWTNLNSQFGTHFGSMNGGYPIKCSHAKTASSINEYAVGTCYAETGNLNIRIMDSTADLTAWRQYLVDQANNGTPIQVWANVGTPIEVDLTPTQISTLLGTNNIWSSGQVEVAFEYDGLLAELPQQATAVVGRCLLDIDFSGASTQSLCSLVVKRNQQEV